MAHRLIPLTPPLFFHFTLPLTIQIRVRKNRNTLRPPKVLVITSDWAVRAIEFWTRFNYSTSTNFLNL
jgi:hypothetical protein